ncbi:phosphatase [Actinomadura madurae]|uniref:phosphatase n=1 Tax=Actinomadura madurae TaxID=1993 RepID=UPI0020D20644|nr:phosphatase [Actinomadura madurae]
MRSAPTRDELRSHLVRTMIAGDVATPRQNNLLHYRRMAAGNPYYQFGLELKPSWTEQTVLEMMVERCGVDPDPHHLYGDDTIDPDITLDMLEAMGDRIGLAARRRENVVVATGHPATLTPLYQAVARELIEAGCRILTPAARLDVRDRDRLRRLGPAPHRLRRPRRRDAGGERPPDAPHARPAPDGGHAPGAR